MGHDVTMCHWLIPLKVEEKIDRGKKFAPFPWKAVQKYVEKENVDGIKSSKCLFGSAYF